MCIKDSKKPLGFGNHHIFIFFAIKKMKKYENVKKMKTMKKDEYQYTNQHVGRLIVPKPPELPKCGCTSCV